MSTAYHVHCRTCNVTVAGSWVNHQDTALAVLANREYFRALAELWHHPPPGISLELGRGCFQVGYQEGCFDLEEFIVHDGHELVVRDEYGHDHDQCAASFRCKECNAWHYCALPRAHEGEEHKAKAPG